MNPTIKARIEKIKNGEVPEGYKRTKIGIVPNEWEISKIGNISKSVIPGATPSTSVKEYWGGNIKWMSSGEIHNRFIYNTRGKISQKGYDACSTTMLPAHCVLVALAGQGKTRGCVAVNEVELCTNQSIAAIVPNDIHYLYLFYFLENKYLELRKISSGDGTRGGLNISLVNGFQLLIPLEAEQQKIAEILATQDKVIELKEKLLKEKQRQKKYLMQQLLTGKKRLPGFSGEWKKQRLVDLCKIIADGDWIESKDQSDEGIRLIQTGNIGVGQYLNKLNRARYISEETFIRLSCSEVFPGDVLLSRLPDPIGRACKIPKLKCRMITAVDCTILRFKKEVCADLFVQYSCMDEWQNKMVLLSGGSTRKRITRNEIENAVITLPIDEGEQTAIAQILSTADKEIELLKKDIEQEKLKKKSLMQLLLTGIVRVVV